MKSQNKSWIPLKLWNIPPLTFSKIVVFFILNLATLWWSFLGAVIVRQMSFHLLSFFVSWIISDLLEQGKIKIQKKVNSASMIVNQLVYIQSQNDIESISNPFQIPPTSVIFVMGIGRSFGDSNLCVARGSPRHYCRFFPCLFWQTEVTHPVTGGVGNASVVEVK